MTKLELDLAQSIGETFTRVAQRNERKVGAIRAASLTLASLVGVRIMEPATLRLAITWMTLAWLIVLAAPHRRYRRHVPFVTVALDAATIASFTFVAQPGRIALAITALVSTIFAISGAIRPQRWWIFVTTALAIGTTALAAYSAHVLFFEGLLLCALIAIAGVLGAWLARISRRAFESEVHRVVAGRFVSPQILDAGYRAPLRELTEARALEATVLVSDIRAFTSYAETRPPSEVLEFLNEVQGTFAAIVHEHHGVVDKFMGDGMLAVFAREEHAAHAIAAAREIAAAASQFEVKIGVGVHSGRVIAGVLGSGSRLELTVIGDTVNIASRLESLSKEKQVTALISDAVVDLAGSQSLVPLGPARIRGRAQEVIVYTLAA